MSRGRPSTGSGGTEAVVLEATSVAPLLLKGSQLLLTGRFVRQGSDLLIVAPDGKAVLIRDFFTLDSPPDLISESGVRISADVAARLAETFGSSGVPAGDPRLGSVGSVDSVRGEASIVQANGARFRAEPGTP
ncbi:MAG: hypothetical protein EXQ86_03025, partial [Rhodospirillales bacterium]|nr:hypothetical protein [Rhodospirillales bacterium]